MYAGWLGLTWAHRQLPLPLLVVLGGIVIAWHGSLQHETIHGHPGGPPWRRLAIGMPPLALWLPYLRYRDTHRQHHETEALGDPEHDPESPGALPLAELQETTLGRLVVGPFVVITWFLATELEGLLRGDRARRHAWRLHLATLLPVVAWLSFTGIPFWKYVVAFVLPGASLSLVRSFAEHRPDPLRHRRTVVVEAGLFFRLLYLNNNLHLVHHAAPRTPWFELPRVWREERFLLAPELVEPGYLQFLWKRLVRR